MVDFLKILSRKNSLRKHCQDLSSDALSKIISDLTVILQEHKTQEQQRTEQELAKSKKIELIRQAMLDSGIDYDDLKDVVAVAPKKKVEAKYRVVVDGVTHEWSGRGRTPVVFQKHFDENSTTKESCLIK